MAGGITNGARLTAQSWQALRDNRHLLVFPLVSGVVLTLVTVVFVASLLGTGVVEGVSGTDGQATSGATILGLVEVFLFYLVCSFVVIFSNTALVATVLRLADGESATVGDGIRAAVRRLPRIIVFALISATIGLLARSIAQSGRSSNNVLVAIVAAVVGAIVQGAWNLVVFFAIPVIVAEDLGTIASLKRSVAIFRETWGEAFTGRAVIGGISCLVYLLVILGAGALIALGVALDVPVLIGGAIAAAIIAIGLLALLSGAVNGVFQASLYRYATTGDAGPLISTSDAAAAFSGTEAPAP
jgi:hypothetical protein